MTNLRHILSGHTHDGLLCGPRLSRWPWHIKTSIAGPWHFREAVRTCCDLRRNNHSSRDSSSSKRRNFVRMACCSLSLIGGSSGSVLSVAASVTFLPFFLFFCPPPSRQRPLHFFALEPCLSLVWMVVRCPASSPPGPPQLGAATLEPSSSRFLLYRWPPAHESASSTRCIPRVECPSITCFLVIPGFRAQRSATPYPKVESR